MSVSSIFIHSLSAAWNIHCERKGLMQYSVEGRNSVTYWNPSVPPKIFRITRLKAKNTNTQLLSMNREASKKKVKSRVDVQLYSFFNLGIKWEWVDTATARPFCPRERVPVPIVRSQQNESKVKGKVRPSTGHEDQMESRSTALPFL